MATTATRDYTAEYLTAATARHSLPAGAVAENIRLLGLCESIADAAWGALGTFNDLDLDEQARLTVAAG